MDFIREITLQNGDATFTSFTVRTFQESDFGLCDGFCKYEGGEGLIYPPELWESNDSFRRRLEQFPEGCMAVVNPSSELVAYSFSHPWNKNSIVPLNCVDLVIPEDADCYYLHDLAVIPAYRRRGIAQVLLHLALGIARRHGFKLVKGVAVQNSHKHWEKCGFKVGEEITYGTVPGRIITIQLD